MATLVKEHEGIVYNENFREKSLTWSLSPSSIDCLRFEPDGLHILHSNHYVTYTMKEMEDPYCLIMQLEHTPIDEEDIAGLIVLSDTNNYAECQTYLATSPSTIGNNGENVNAGYDLSSKYVGYSFDDEEEEESSNIDSSSSSETVVHPITGFVDVVYKYIRMIKFNNQVGHTYQFFASSDGISWIEVGNTDYNENNSIGFFLYGTKNEKVLRKGKFVINAFHIYENPYITINGINILEDFEIYDPHLKRTILRSDTFPGRDMVNHNGNNVKINTNHLVLPLHDAKIRIYSKMDYSDTRGEYTLDNYTFGGDIFTITRDIKLFIDNEEVLAGNTYDLGTLFTNKFRKNIVIYNNEDYSLGNIKVSIVAYSEYYSGEEVIKLALYHGNEAYQKDYEDYHYNDYVIIDRLEAHTGQELIMKLSDVPKQEFYSVANKYRFKLLIE